MLLIDRHRVQSRRCFEVLFTAARKGASRGVSDSTTIKYAHIGPQNASKNLSRVPQDAVSNIKVCLKRVDVLKVPIKKSKSKYPAPGWTRTPDVEDASDTERYQWRASPSGKLPHNTYQAKHYHSISTVCFLM